MVVWMGVGMVEMGRVFRILSVIMAVSFIASAGPSGVARADGLETGDGVDLASSTPGAGSMRDVLSNMRWGVGLAGASYPHYPGADQDDQLVLPIPYLEYYGTYFQIDNDGLAAHLFRNDRVALDVSVNGALPVDSEDNRARSGMPDLEFMGEIGPSVQLTLARGATWQARFDLPVRVNLDLGGDVLRDRGATIDPRFHIERNWQALGGEVTAEIDLGALYGDRRYHDVFYAVAPAYETASRAAYTPAGGLLAYRASTTVEFRRGPYLAIGYLRFLDLSDSKNAASPLMQKDDYLAGGVALIRLFDGF